MRVEYVVIGVALYLLYRQYAAQPRVEMVKKTKVKPIMTSLGSNERAQPKRVTLQVVPKISQDSE
jgi:hypothetical protein